MKPSHLSVAYAIRKQAMKKMAKGGMSYPVEKDPHYAEGGMVDEMDSSEPMADDLDHPELMEHMPEEVKPPKRGLLHAMMEKIRKRHMGK